MKNEFTEIWGENVKSLSISDPLYNTELKMILTHLNVWCKLKARSVTTFGAVHWMFGFLNAQVAFDKIKHRVVMLNLT